MALCNTISNAKLIELMKKFCQEHEEYNFYEEYSGRGMFGKVCVGITTTGNSYKMIVQLCDYLRDKAYGTSIISVETALGEICRDKLGMNTIIYFPSISISSEEIIKCSECGYWTDTDDIYYGTCSCDQSSAYGCRTIGYHKCSCGKQNG